MGNVYTKSGALARRIYFGATLIFESLYALFRTRVLNDGGTFLEIELPYTIDSEILLLTPNAYKVGKLYSAKPTNGTGDFTVVRNSTATYVGQDGLIKTALANEVRLDWSTGVPVVLLEPQRTNLITYSEDFSNNSWIKAAVSVYLNQTISPDGNVNAGKVVFNGDSSSRLSQNVVFIDDTNYVFSSYVKNINMTNDIYGVVFFLNNGTTAYVVFNINNGSVDVNDIAKTTSSIKNVGNGWFKINIMFNSLIGTASNNIRAAFVVSGTTQIGDSLYLWGAQLEQASTASSYIPTNGTTVTRLADNISVPTPAGVTSITETIDGVEQTPITTIPATYSLPVGNINKVTTL